MQKSIEDRLTDIERSIDRVAKTQVVVLKVLLLMRKTSASFDRTDRSLNAVKESLEPIHRYRDRDLVLIFGVITVLGVGYALLSLYLTTRHVIYGALSIAYIVLVFVLIFRMFVESRRAGDQLREAEKMMTQASKDVKSLTEEEASLEDDLTQVAAELKELFPDNSVSEPKSED